MTAAALGVESALVMLAVASVAAIQARAVRGAQRTTIQELCERRGRPERYTEIVAASETIAFIAASVVVVAAVGATLLMFPRLMAAGDRSLALEISAVLTWIGSAWLALVVVPMLLVRFAGPWIVVATWAVWRPIVGLIAPAVGQLGRLASAVGRRGDAATERPRDELRLAVDDAHREGRLAGSTRDMIKGIIGLDEIRVATIMTPRTKITSIPLDSSWEEAVRRAAESGHTRLPVWDRSPDDVVGILHTRDVLTRLAEPSGSRPADLRSLLRPPWFVPESMSVQKMMLEFQRGNTHMAVVTDEFGGVSGVVTIEDALEEIVGEIADEYDTAAPEVTELPDGAFRMLARMHVDDAGDLLGIEVDSEDEGVDTVLGLLAKRLGRVPIPGATVELDGWQLTAEQGAGRRNRIGTVLAQRVDGEAANGEGSSA